MVQIGKLENFIQTIPALQQYLGLRCFVRLEQIYGKKWITVVDVKKYEGCSKYAADRKIYNLQKKLLIRSKKIPGHKSVQWTLTPYGRKVFKFMESIEAEFNQLNTKHEPQKVRMKMDNNQYRKSE